MMINILIYRPSFMLWHIHWHEDEAERVTLKAVT